MPLPEGADRIAFAGDSRIFPPQSSDKIEIGYIRPLDEVFGDPPIGNPPHTAFTTLLYYRVTHALLDRTFVYRILREQARALFVPTNKERPNLEIGDWYYGSVAVWDYIRTNSHPTNPGQTVEGILLVGKFSDVRWQAEGASTAREISHIIRPLLSPRDSSPIEFRGIYDNGCPDICDSH